MIFLILSILSSAAMALLLRLFSKQRGNRYGLVFGNYLTCVLIAMLIMTAGSGTTGALLRVFGWFIAIPVAMGTLVSWRLASRSMRAEAHLAEAEPEWKKYVNRR